MVQPRVQVFVSDHRLSTLQSTTSPFSHHPIPLILTHCLFTTFISSLLSLNFPSIFHLSIFLCLPLLRDGGENTTRNSHSFGELIVSAGRLMPLSYYLLPNGRETVRKHRQLEKMVLRKKRQRTKLGCEIKN